MRKRLQERHLRIGGCDVDAITPQDAQRIVTSYLKVVEMHATGDVYPCSSRELPESKQTIRTAFSICVSTLTAMGQLTVELREYLEVAYVSLADYVSDESAALLREYGRAGEELAADRRMAREKVGTDAWRTLSEQSRLAGEIARAISDEGATLRAEFRAWLSLPAEAGSYERAGSYETAGSHETSAADATVITKGPHHVHIASSRTASG